MKTKLTEIKSKSGFGLARHSFGRLLCLGAVILICSSASAQNLFVSGSDANGGKIFKFTWDGVQSIFASGLDDPHALAFDGAGNLFVAVNGGIIYKYQPNGVRSTFASGLDYTHALAFDSADNLFVANFSGGVPHMGTGTVYKFTPDGTQSTFASGLSNPTALTFDGAANLFVADIGSASPTIYKFTPAGVRTTFATNLGPDLTSVACDSASNLFVAVYVTGVVRHGHGDGYIAKFTPDGVRSTFASRLNGPLALTFDNVGNLFVEDAEGIDSTETKYYPGAIYKYTPNGHQTTFAPRVRHRDLSRLALIPIQQEQVRTQCHEVSVLVEIRRCFDRARPPDAPEGTFNRRKPT